MRTVVALVLVACAGVMPAHADDLTLDAARQRSFRRDAPCAPTRC
jgi:hypothetical protein